MWRSSTHGTRSWSDEHLNHGGRRNSAAWAPPTDWTSIQEALTHGPRFSRMVPLGAAPGLGHLEASFNTLETFLAVTRYIPDHAGFHPNDYSHWSQDFSGRGRSRGWCGGCARPALTSRRSPRRSGLKSTANLLLPEGVFSLGSTHGPSAFHHHDRVALGACGHLTGRRFNPTQVACLAGTDAADLGGGG